MKQFSFGCVEFFRRYQIIFKQSCQLRELLNRGSRSRLNLPDILVAGIGNGRGHVPRFAKFHGGHSPQQADLYATAPEGRRSKDFLKASSFFLHLALKEVPREINQHPPPKNDPQQMIDDPAEKQNQDSQTGHKKYMQQQDKIGNGHTFHQAGAVLFVFKCHRRIKWQQLRVRALGGERLGRTAGG